MKFRKYNHNIFVLQRAALKIQHWYFNKRLHSKFITYVPYQVKPAHPAKANGSSAGLTTRDQKQKVFNEDLKIK